MYEVGGVVVAVVFGISAQHVDFLFVGSSRLAYHVAYVVVGGIFEHTIGTEVEVVAGLHVGGVVYVGFRAALHIGLHGSGYDILAWEGLCFLGCQLTYFQQVVDQRVVFRLEAYFHLTIGCGS